MKGKLLIIACLLACVAFAEYRVVTSEFKDNTFTASSALGWNFISNRKANIVTTCSDKSIVGGFGIFGSSSAATKTFNSGFDHSQLVITFDLYSIDTWDQEKFFLYLDDQIVYTYQGVHSYATPAPDNISCGLSNKDRLIHVSVKVPHYRRDFELKLTTNLDQNADDESWGFRNFQVTALSGEYRAVTKEFAQSDFQKDLTGWDVNVDQDKVFTSCNGIKLFGGFSVFGKGTLAKKTYSNLPSHSIVVVQLDLWFIDSPDSNDFVSIIIDGQVFKQLRPNFNHGDAENFLCGQAGWSDKQRKVSIQVPHKGNSVTVAFKGTFDENNDNESFGIRNLQIGIIKCTGSCKLGSNDLSSETFSTAPGWTNAKGDDLSASVTTCSSQSYFGPQSQLVSKSFVLPPHSSVKILVRIVTLGKWNSDSLIHFLVNGVYVEPQTGEDFEKGKVCNDASETIRTYIIETTHAVQFLEFSILPLSQQTGASFIVRDLQVLTYNEAGRNVVSTQFDTVNFDNVGLTGWEIKGNAGSGVASTCGKFSLFGGYNAFGSKTKASKVYNNLEAHDTLIISVALWFLDTWDNEKFYIQVDGEDVWTGTKSSVWENQRLICGYDTAKDENSYVEIIVPHNAATATILFKDTLDENQTNESWGIRELVVSTGVDQSAVIVSNECITVFSECQFAGESQKVCEDVPDLKQAGWPSSIKSISIPNGKQLTVFKKTNYSGDKQDFTDSESCLSGTSYFLINKAFNIKVEEETPRLKKHQKKN